MKATILLASALIASVAAAGLTTVLPSTRALGAPRVSDKTVLKKLPVAKNEKKPPTYPFPTNAWWSGGSLEAWPAPLYAWPLVVDLSADGVKVDYPTTTVAENTIHSTENAPVRVRFDTAPDKATVSSYGDWDVTFDLLSGASRMARVTAVQGSPYAWIESDARQLHLDLAPGSTSSAVACAKPCVGARTVVSGDTTYLIATTGTIAEREGRLTVTLPMAGAKTVSIAVVAPDGRADAYLKHALTIPRRTSVSWKETQGNIDTTFAYPSTGLMGLLPHHVDTLKYRLPKPIGTYQTLRGPVTVIETKSFTTRVFVPKIEEDPALHPTLKKDGAFLATLRTEIDSQNPAAGDSYAAGKQLLRSALLARLASGTDDAALREDALDAAKKGLAEWCGGKYSYDARLGGIIGEPTSFGSEHYNDHHFHYGYVIHAAAVVAKLDRSWARDYGDCIDLLVRDIAAGRDDASFPALRYMDAYAGHSWANGLTRFADGQNQESVSEAVHAWYAVALWGDLMRQKDVALRGRWLLSQELQGAKSYWYNAGDTPTLPEGFGHPMVSILWGGKADFATFFDPAEAAIHGIQFFPVVTGIRGLLESDVAGKLVTPLARSADATLWVNNLRMAALLAKQRAPDPGRPLDPFYSESYVRNWTATY